MAKGDGVNDVAAMKQAGCGMALLNGYGEESVDSSRSGKNVSSTKGSGNHKASSDTPALDPENQRQLDQIKTLRIGSQRQIPKKALAVPVGESQAAVNARVRQRIEQAQLELERDIAKRQGVSDIKNIRMELSDVKKFFAISSQIRREESKRARLLRKGGGEAARILAEDNVAGDPNATTDSIRAGEVSLVAAFSYLRPAIDGVEHLLRYSLTAAAFATASLRSTAISSLSAAILMATVFRKGLAYGKVMFQVETMVDLHLRIAQDLVQSQACSRLSKIPGTQRRMHSLFDFDTILSMCAELLLQMTTFFAGVRVARQHELLEKASQGNENHGPSKSRIRWKPVFGDENNHNTLFDTVATALAKSDVESLVSRTKEEDDSGNKRGIIRTLIMGKPFTPNVPTNTVFLLTIFQKATSALIDVTGKPYSIGILEDRRFCMLLVVAILGPILLLFETIPSVNRVLELKPIDSVAVKLKLLTIMLLDLIGCSLIGWLWKASQNEGIDQSKDDDDGKKDDNEAALASMKLERLRQEERQTNQQLVLSAALLVFGVVVSQVKF